MRLAIGSIFKNEAPYILEWVAFHRAVGVDAFFIADNASDDGSSELLAGLGRAGVIHHIPFPHVPGEPPQLPAYREILRRHGAMADWIAFIDADEFLMPAPGTTSIRPAVAARNRDRTCGAIAVNWAIYGSSGQSRADPRPVLERFVGRAPQASALNRQYKSIVRPEAVAGTRPSPHCFDLKPGFRTLHVDGRLLRFGPKRREGVAARTVWAPLRLNHYVIKSHEEFARRKQARGRAMVNAFRDEAFFARHDRNEVEEPVASDLLASTERERRRLETLLTASAPRRWYGRLAAGTAWHGMRKELQIMVDRAKPLLAKFRGSVDAVDLAPDGTVRIRGWALTGAKRPFPHFAVLVEGAPAMVTDVRHVARPDVVAAVRGADPNCGFVLTATWPAGVPKTAAPRPALSVTAVGRAGETFALAAGEAARWHMPPPVAKRAVATRGSADGSGEIPVPDAPIMPPEAVAALAEALKGSAAYLEYGSGGSTVLAVGADVPALVSIESDPVWLEAVKRKLGTAFDPERHHLLHGDIGPTHKFGHPVSDQHWRQYRTYPLAPWQLCRQRELEPDLVLVDGRFRPACFLAALLFGKEGCRILFDDYFDRPKYHPVSRFVMPRHDIGRVAEFVVPASLPRDEVWLSFVEALTDPD